MRIGEKEREKEKETERQGDRGIENQRYWQRD